MPTILRVWPFSKKIMVHLKIEKYLYFKGNLSIYHLRILIHKNIIQQQTVSFRRASSFLFICQMMPLKFKYFSIFKCTIIFFENGQTLRILGIWQICLLFIYFPSKLRKLLCEIPLNSTGENCVFS